jgi:hypothetical protein
MKKISVKDIKRGYQLCVNSENTFPDTSSSNASKKLPLLVMGMLGTSNP